MVKVPLAPNAASRRSEKFRVYLLLVFGIAFLGTAITIIGLAGSSTATVGVGAGVIAAAGLISIFFGLVGLRLTRKTDEDVTVAVTHDTHTDEQYSNWSPKPSRRFPGSFPDN